MTNIAVSPAWFPQSNTFVSPSGGGLKGLIIDVAIPVIETIITNYVNEQVNAISKKVKDKSADAINKALGQPNRQRRTGLKRRKTYNFKNFRRSKKYNRRTYDNPKFFKYG